MYWKCYRLIWLQYRITLYQGTRARARAREEVYILKPQARNIESPWGNQKLEVDHKNIAFTRKRKKKEKKKTIMLERNALLDCNKHNRGRHNDVYVKF